MGLQMRSCKGKLVRKRRLFLIGEGKLGLSTVRIISVKCKKKSHRKKSVKTVETEYLIRVSKHFSFSRVLMHIFESND